MRETRLTIWPVFYDVDPSVVRKPTGTFEQAINEHKKRFKHDITKVEIWKAALAKVANIFGWHLQDRHESEFIQHIVKEMMKKLSSKPSSIIKKFIAMESIMAKFIPLYLGFENNVRMIGIYGMGGLGKTTLARVVYDEFRSHFEGSSFIANVREDSKKHGLPQLQQQLLADILEDRNIYVRNVYDGVDLIKERLHRKKVLLVIDDVDHLDQLTNLAGEQDWFGLGSWIIITTRDEHVLKLHGVLNRYNPNGLNNDDALKLFCLKAFKNEQPEKGYMQLSQVVVKYASGLPLALITLGSFLFGRTIVEWQSALYSFKDTEGEIFDILKISYDGLKEMWKKIFLDIACFFRGWEKNQVIEILENCGFKARIGISVLLDKSLLTVNYKGSLEMHDLLQEMGEKIVCFESGGNLEKQSRLWLINDLLHVLENNKATKAIQAIVVSCWEKYFNFEEFFEGFLKMSNLRLLVIKTQDVLINQRHLALPNNLRYLSWRECPFKCLASSHKRMAFVQLDLQHSKFEYLWEGVMRSVNLKFIDLSHSNRLIRTPDFSGVPNLEGLNLSDCFRLVEIHPSIGKLNRLERLNLSCCGRLVEIHPSIGQLSRLKYLDLQHCYSLTVLPTFSSEMESLTVLNIYGCSSLNSFPKFTGIMKSLSKLNLGYTTVKNPAPSSIFKCLTALTFLDLSSCSKLESLPRIPSTVRYINVEGWSALKWSPERVKLSIWSQPLSQWLPYDESGSRLGFTILFHFLQGLLCRKAILDGSIFPSCLTQAVENSISIELPSNWYNSKWIGFTLWAAVSSLVDFENGIRFRARVIALSDTPQNHCASELFTILINRGACICLLYLSRDDWFSTVGNDECSQIKVVFEIDKRTLHMGKCGVSLIYKQDVNEFNQTNAQCLIKSFGEEVCIYKLTAGDDDDDDDDDVHIVNNDDDVHIVRDDVLIFGDDDFDDDDI
ncbi:disease resistance protein RUN1-like isoform X3 [Quercus robur]|uniref:disease resistance protein RUN1-like isoform X3 n=1 Tax=Quercus robur TaxID=38942 RepID=UPI002162433E|nr:disease resistance protein RUN1-like isoform X3 [Quercus robur]